MPFKREAEASCERKEESGWRQAGGLQANRLWKLPITMCNYNITLKFNLLILICTIKLFKKSPDKIVIVEDLFFETGIYFSVFEPLHRLMHITKVQEKKKTFCKGFIYYIV